MKIIVETAWPVSSSSWSHFVTLFVTGALEARLFEEGRFVTGAWEGSLKNYVEEGVW